MSSLIERLSRQAREKRAARAARAAEAIEAEAAVDSADSEPDNLRPLVASEARAKISKSVARWLDKRHLFGS